MQAACCGKDTFYANTAFELFSAIKPAAVYFSYIC